MTREIPLSKGLVALVDDADYDYIVAAGPWHAAGRPEQGLYAVHTQYVPPDTFRAIYMHKLLVQGAMRVDHINRNRLDNRRSNLRPATDSQNSSNRRQRSDSNQPYKGIRRDKNAWVATITARGETRHLGTFPTPEEAACSYDAAARDLHGEFAAVNFPEEIHS